MDLSPRRRSIEQIDGNAEGIKNRGLEMKNLGMQMTESASILKKIKDGTEGQGYSVDKIKDSVGELHVDLANAAERYLPSGVVVLQYGEALGSAQTNISGIIDECERLWGLYISASGQVDDASGASIPADETPEQKVLREDAAEELAGSKASAYQAWSDEAGKFDNQYDTWDEAYETAVSGLQDVNDDGVTDSFWDDALPFIEGALTVLTWVGIALAVVCLFVAGPVLAVVAGVAAALAVISLILTIVKVANGRGGVVDIGLAVVGVIPFGRLASLAKGGTKLAPFVKGFLGDMTGLSGITHFNTLMDARRLPALFSRFPPTNSAGNLVGSTNIVNNITGLADDFADLSHFRFNPGGAVDNILGGPSGSFNAGVTEALSRYGKNIQNHVTTYFPQSVGDLLPSIPDKVGNVVDMVGKPVISLVLGIGAVVDRLSPATDETWQLEMKTSS